MAFKVVALLAFVAVASAQHYFTDYKPYPFLAKTYATAYDHVPVVAKTFDHVPVVAKTYEHFEHVPVVAKTYDHVPVVAKTYDHVPVVAKTYEHFEHVPVVAKTYEHFPVVAKTYDHVPVVAKTYDHVPVVAKTYDHVPVVAKTYEHVPVVAKTFEHVAPVAVKKFEAVADVHKEAEYDHHPIYDFGYSVNDPLTGDSKAAFESRKGDVVKGSYSLAEADGSKRIVDYTADPVHGFNAVVHKEVPAKAAVVAHAQVAHAPVAYTAHKFPASTYPFVPAYISNSFTSPYATYAY